MNIRPETHAPASSASCCCRLCGATLQHSFVNLGMSPLCESFVAPADADAMEPYYPLHAMVCSSCFLVQLSEYVKPEKIFRDYAYYSSYSVSWVAHAKDYCSMTKARFRLGPHSQVVELASNDGYLLQHFLPLKVPALGIEPAENVAEVAVAKGIDTRVEFFDERLAAELVDEGRSADLIIGNNVLAQVPDLNGFAAGIARLLKPEGVVTLEFPHLLRLMDEAQFDTIYHEHFSYFSLIAIDRLAAQHGLRVFDVTELSTHGGSLRVYLCHRTSAHPEEAAVANVLARELCAGLAEIATYAAFSDQVRRSKRRLLSFLIAAKDAGKRICGYGAPGKGNTLLNYCGIGRDFLDFTVDRNPHKHGHLTPGMRIPIHPVDAIDAFKPDYLLVLPWNLEREIVRQMRHIADWGGKFVLPIPDVKIIDPRELSL